MSDMQPWGPAGTASDLTRCPASHQRVTDGPAGARHAMIPEVIRSGGDVKTVSSAIGTLMTVAFLGTTVAGCSVERIAVNMIGGRLNCFPSMHCSVAMLTALHLLPHLGPAIFAFPALIGLSCLFTKQHFVIDVPAGLALGWATYKLFLIMIEPSYREAEILQHGL